ncbi:hypothetical protein ACFLZM_08370, partial [Thermodesulfobacteriota bacterium]
PLKFNYSPPNSPIPLIAPSARPCWAHASTWRRAIPAHRKSWFASHVARGKRKEADTDDKIPCILEPELTDKVFRKNWARLIQKIYEVDPLVCPRCFSKMRVIAMIEDPIVIKKILKHLDLWEIKRKPRPVANAPPDDIFCEYDEQPGPRIDDYITDPEYPVEAYFF